ncbi:MAG: hypothetical protein E5W87_13515 [Mesorhizobium sp.]|nr:MAG: hypothetical protein E5W87_13515 [Mesorhizobium sp.]
MPIYAGKRPNVAKSASKRTFVARSVAFWQFVADYFIDATLSAMVTTIITALVIEQICQNWIVRRSLRGAAAPSHSSCARCDDEGL